ncbi:heme o synthase [Pseudoalteromonas viridis]|uniref:Protoheme IX farnesyltransferase n=1 Tax=Pseudoalteromonas viridis TaxID=339617 RepID=A0ABX7V7C2_9GAMM|nr:heme o synthase [Pseudoalteromonas viridis]QTL36786.1 heme o synthase [Pseudoalteromonas viridis]
MAMSVHQLGSAFPDFYAGIKPYLAITKAKVVMMLVLTAWVGLALAPDTGRTVVQQLMSLLSIGLISAAAAAVNHVVDRNRDSKMARTRHRPLARQQLCVSKALLFAACLAIIGTTGLLVFSNWLCTVLTLLALLGYAVVYTMFLKHMTPQNIVIGGLAGALPPLLGWVSETGSMAAEPWLLVMIIFAWTPPHFWALAIAREADYARAGTPMLPVTHGIQFTKLCIVVYTLLLSVTCVLPYLIGMVGYVYFATASVLNGLFIFLVVRLYIHHTGQQAMGVFRFSIWYLLLLFVSLFVDRALI